MSSNGFKYEKATFSLGLSSTSDENPTIAAPPAALSRFLSLTRKFSEINSSDGHAEEGRQEAPPSGSSRQGINEREELPPGGGSSAATTSISALKLNKAASGTKMTWPDTSSEEEDQPGPQDSDMELNDSENSLAKETKKKRMKKNKKKKIANLEENVCDEQPEYIPLPSTVPVAKTIGKAGPHADEADIQAGEEAGEEAAAQEGSAASRRPYWMSNCSSIKSPLLRLHQEIVSLVELLQPTPAEVADRQAAVDAVEEVVKSVWPHATVAVFGSFATGLYVPTSDVDLVVMDTKTDVQTGLKALANLLSRKGVAKSMQVIAKAKVPIIKFETVEHGNLAFDISFDVPNGPQAAVLVKEVINDWPMIRPLVLVLKLFLQQRELNEVYSGGIGSYALITMLIAFLQLHNSRRRGPSAKPGKRAKPPASPLEQSLGVLLIDFFRLYGRVINMKDVGISATGGGHYFSKRDKDGVSWVTEGREYMLSVEDPKDPSNDICRGSYNIMRVKSAFDFAYQQLAAPSRPDESLLQRILRLAPILASRQRPANPSLFYPSRTDIKDQTEGPGGSKRKGVMFEAEEEGERDEEADEDRRQGKKKRQRNGGGQDEEAGRSSREVLPSERPVSRANGGDRKRKSREGRDRDEELPASRSRESSDEYEEERGGGKQSGGSAARGGAGRRDGGGRDQRPAPYSLIQKGDPGGKWGGGGKRQNAGYSHDQSGGGQHRHVSGSHLTAIQSFPGYQSGLNQFGHGGHGLYPQAQGQLAPLAGYQQHQQYDQRQYAAPQPQWQQEQPQQYSSQQQQFGAGASFVMGGGGQGGYGSGNGRHSGHDHHHRSKSKSSHIRFK